MQGGSNSWTAGKKEQEEKWCGLAREEKASYTPDEKEEDDHIQRLNLEDRIERLEKKNEKLVDIVAKLVAGKHQSVGNCNSKVNISNDDFLEKCCKEAQSIQHFIKNIKFELADVWTGTLPVENAVWKLLEDRLKKLKVTERPMHCINI